MRHRSLLLVPLTAVTVLAACATADSTGPAAREARASTRDLGAVHSRTTPGSQGNRLPCNVPSDLNGSAIIGPQGGTLDIGPHRLIIPPGALTARVAVSGFIPAGTTIEVHFEPHGLQFKKPAGLILNSSACGTVPDVVYLNEAGVIAERIKAIFSEWWHTIAAPIDHFSVYALEV